MWYRYLGYERALSLVDLFASCKRPLSSPLRATFLRQEGHLWAQLVECFAEFNQRLRPPPVVCWWFVVWTSSWRMRGFSLWASFSSGEVGLGGALRALLCAPLVTGDGWCGFEVPLQTREGSKAGGEKGTCLAPRTKLTNRKLQELSWGRLDYEETVVAGGTFFLRWGQSFWLQWRGNRGRWAFNFQKKKWKKKFPKDTK